MRAHAQLPGHVGAGLAGVGAKALAREVPLGVHEVVELEAEVAHFHFRQAAPVGAALEVMLFRETHAQGAGFEVHAGQSRGRPAVAAVSDSTTAGGEPAKRMGYAQR